jgi:hypothetical protein
MTIREGQHQQCRRQRKANPRRKATKPTGPQDTQRKAHLTAGRPRQRLRESDQLSQSSFAAPSPAFDNLLLKVPQMRHRATEGHTAESQEDE